MPDDDWARDRASVAGADFEVRMREVLTRVDSALDEQAGLRLLIDAVVSMAADLTLDDVLARIVEIARELTGARYAALGVLGSGPDKRLRTFVHHGMSSGAGRARSARCPRGTGSSDCSSTDPSPCGCTTSRAIRSPTGSRPSTRR